MKSDEEAGDLEKIAIWKSEKVREDSCLFSLLWLWAWHFSPVFGPLNRICGILGDAYFDRKQLMDIQVMGTLGLSEENIEAIRQVKGVEKSRAGVFGRCAGGVKGKSESTSRFFYTWIL